MIDEQSIVTAALVASAEWQEIKRRYSVYYERCNMAAFLRDAINSAAPVKWLLMVWQTAMSAEYYKQDDLIRKYQTIQKRLATRARKTEKAKANGNELQSS